MTSFIDLLWIFFFVENISFIILGLFSEFIWVLINGCALGRFFYFIGPFVLIVLPNGALGGSAGLIVLEKVRCSRCIIAVDAVIRTIQLILLRLRL